MLTRRTSKATATTVKVDVDVQYASTDADLPATQDVSKWIACALRERSAPTTLTVRIVDEEEGRLLNERWRGGSGATNVLSFTAEGLEEVAPELLGDIVVCAPVAAREAHAQGKSPHAHWAHLLIHGTLHLLGFDHESVADAAAMENRERLLLAELGFADPYQPVAETP